MKTLLTFTFIVISLRGSAQSSSVVSYFEIIRAGRTAEATDILKRESPDVVLLNVMRYFTDSIQAVRSAAYRLTYLTGITSQVTKIRQQATEHLVQGYSFGNDINEVTAYLRQFNRADFSTGAKDSIESLIKKGTSSTEILKLAGYLEMHELENHVRLLTQPGNLQSVRWAALLALSRMGDTAALDNVLNKVRKLKINDDLVYDIFPDLIFTRQKPAIQFMVDVMQSNNMDCFSADAELEVTIPCGYRIMEQLAPVIQGYPLKLDVSGDIKTKNYTEALTTVRSWFAKHPEFVIVNNTY